MKPNVDRFYPFHAPEGAYVVFTVSLKDSKVIRAGIYSSPAQGLTSSNLREEIMLNGPSMPGETYAEALVALEKLIEANYPLLKAWL